MNNSIFNLCLVTDLKHRSLEEYLGFIQSTIKGGVTLVQFRDKNSSYEDIRSTALALKNFLSPLKIPFLINDYVQLAAEIDADGVHIGVSDYLPLEARAVLGPNKIIGYSVETYQQLDEANHLECINYIAASAVFPSPTKTDCKTIWGLAGLNYLVTHSKHPVIAIGGITSRNVGQVINHGAQGVAVISALHQSDNPRHTAQELIKKINKEKGYA